MRTTYEILATAPVNSDESTKVREAGWRWHYTGQYVCKECGRSWNVWLKDGRCFQCHTIEEI